MMFGEGVLVVGGRGEVEVEDNMEQPLAVYVKPTIMSDSLTWLHRRNIGHQCFLVVNISIIKNYTKN